MRAELDDELDRVKNELNREKMARRALTNQLKKERKWREKCIAVTKGVMQLRAENEGDLKEVSSSKANSPENPSFQDPINLDPASLAYAHALEDFTKSEGAPPPNHTAPPQSPVAQFQQQQQQYQYRQQYDQQETMPPSPANAIIANERRKNKLLTLELMRERAIANGGLTGYGGISVNLPSPTLNSPSALNSAYLPLGSRGAVGEHEVNALRVAVERADIERVLEAEIGIEKDIELERYRVELDEERKASKLNEGRAKELERAVERAVEKERELFAQKEKRRRTPCMELSSS